MIVIVNNRLPMFSALLILAAVCGSSVCGCGAGGASKFARAEAEGKAEFDGKPIPSGTITFQHLESSEMVGCTIENGVYKSATGEGPILGKNAVTVVGYDKPDGKPLWGSQYRVEVDVGSGKFSESFKVAKDKVKPPDPKLQSSDPADNQ